MSKVYQKWAEKKPADAANHVMESPEKRGTSRIFIIAGSVECEDSLHALKRSQNFPEGATSTRPPLTSFDFSTTLVKKEALDLASLIGATKVREKAVCSKKIEQNHVEKIVIVA